MVKVIEALLEGVEAPRIIAITGYARVGKSTLALRMQQWLINQYPHEEHIVYAFATSLKMAVADIIWRHYRVSPFTENPDDKKKIRPFLVSYAMDKRAQDPAYWIKRLDSIIHRQAPSSALIADLRFENEAQWVRDKGGIIMRVRRDDVDPANETEAENDVKVDKFVNYTIQAKNMEFYYYG